MLETSILINKSGIVIGSGAGQKMAVKLFKQTSCVNDGDELSIGSVCASAVEITLFDYENKLDLTAGDEITVMRNDGENSIQGKFIIEQPTRPTANTIKITGYDYVTKLDKDLTAWVAGLTGWPYDLDEFAGMVATQCGLRLGNLGTMTNAKFKVPQFSYSGVTGRKIMHWLCEICAKYCYADGSGTLRFGWYTPSGVTINPTGDRYYFEGALTYEAYQTAKIAVAQLQLADSENGALWPTQAAGVNSYVIRNNPILMAKLDTTAQSALTNIATALKDVTYTPCKIAIPACLDIRAGQTVDIVDKNGKQITAYVMTKVTEGQKDTLECTGSVRRDSTSHLNSGGGVTAGDVAYAAQQAGQQAKDYADQVGKNAEYYADEASRLAAQDAVRRQTQGEIFNKLTNNGELQGLFYQDGKWYINAEYVQIYNLVANAIVSGILESVDKNSYFDLNNGEFVAKSQYGKIVVSKGAVILYDKNDVPRVSMDSPLTDTGNRFDIILRNGSGKSVIGMGVDDGGGILYAPDGSLNGQIVGARVYWETVSGTKMNLVADLF